MSDGPYRKWVATFKPVPVNTPNNKRVCLAHSNRGSYCGRGPGTRSGLTDTWTAVVCSDCIAAGRADGIPDLPKLARST